MAKWHRLEHKQSGEVQIVASLDGIDLDLYVAVPLKGNRAPKEFQVANADGTLSTDNELKAKAQQLPLEERIEALERLLAEKGI